MNTLGLATFRDDEVDGFGAGRLDVRPRCIEMGVVRDDLARTRDDRKEDALGRAALMRRDHMPEGKEPLHRLQETEP